MIIIKIRFLSFIAIVLICIISISLFFHTRKETTTYHSILNDLLQETSVEGISLTDATKQIPYNYVSIEDEESITKIIEQPGEMKLTEINELPLYQYYVRIYTDKEDITLTVGEENILAVYGFNEPMKVYSIEGSNLLYLIVKETMESEYKIKKYPISRD